VHLVFVTSLFNHETPASGYEIANLVIVDELRRAEVPVTLLGHACPGRAPADPDQTALVGTLDIRTAAASWPRRCRWLAKAVVTRSMFAAAKLRAAPAETVRARLAEIGQCDGYILNGPQMPAAFGDLFQDRPAILIAHNAEYRTLEENAEAAGNPILRWLYRREARLSRAAEMRACAAAAFVFALTEEDRAFLDEGGRKSAVLPLVARISPPAPPAKRRIACDAALIGTWTWLPNRIGLEWFLGKVVPELPADFRTDIAGELPGGLSRGHRGVRFVGRVADAADFMRSGAVVALCSRAGTGVQVKTLATFELGLPAVATPHSIRGIERLPENCIVTADPAAYADALIAHSRRRPPGDVDGGIFHARQRQALDGQLRLGLERLRAAAGVPAS